MRACAVVRLGFSSERRFDIVLRALKPEIAKPTTLRSHESLEREGRFLVLSVEAKDTVALRAALHAYLRWISSVIQVLDVLEKHK